jgi:hypothetical protein
VRLFAVAYCRLILHLIARWVEMETAVHITEKYVDGTVSEARLAQMWAARRYYEHLLQPSSEYNPSMAPYRIAVRLAAPDPWAAAFEIARNSAWDADRDVQAALARCIFGNPFRSASIDPAWLAWKDRTVPRLAELVYEERAFERLPVLADALEEAGCTDPEILAHCRGSGEHGRGCWVVDLVLGKT